MWSLPWKMCSAPEPEEPTRAGPRSRLRLDLQHRRAGPGGPLHGASREPEERDVQVPLGQTIEEPEHHPQPAGRAGALPARADRHPVLLGGRDRRAGERARRAVCRAPGSCAATSSGPEHVELGPRELEHRPHLLAVDGHVSGGEAQRVRAGRCRDERAEEEEGEESGRGHVRARTLPGCGAAGAHDFA